MKVGDEFPPCPHKHRAMKHILQSKLRSPDGHVDHFGQ